MCVSANLCVGTGSGAITDARLERDLVFSLAVFIKQDVFVSTDVLTLDIATAHNFAVAHGKLSAVAK
jgi:hypothetical protein